MKSETRSILFLDVAGWSGLKPSQIVAYVEKALPRIHDILSDKQYEASHLNTWGDAIVATFPSTRHAAISAMKIRDFFRQGTAIDGVSSDMNCRISLHIGEVILLHNPIIDRMDIFGEGVHFAARLEPATTKGSVFCSRSFAEQLKIMDGLAPKAHPLGEIDFPKGYGRHEVFEVVGPQEKPTGHPR